MRTSTVASTTVQRMATSVRLTAMENLDKGSIDQKLLSADTDTTVNM